MMSTGMLTRQTCYSEEVFDMLLTVMETVIKGYDKTSTRMAYIAMRAYAYGVIMGKRMERARRKRGKQ